MLVVIVLVGLFLSVEVFIVVSCMIACLFFYFYVMGCAPVEETAHRGILLFIYYFVFQPNFNFKSTIHLLHVSLLLKHSFHLFSQRSVCVYACVYSSAHVCAFESL